MGYVKNIYGIIRLCSGLVKAVIMLIHSKYQLLWPKGHKCNIFSPIWYNTNATKLLSRVAEGLAR